MRIALVLLVAALISLTACEHRSTVSGSGSENGQTGKIGLGLPF